MICAINNEYDSFGICEVASPVWSYASLAYGELADARTSNGIMWRDIGTGRLKILDVEGEGPTT
jgi:hypothetical protein